jgi:uncharacterized protein RhaS with RHS repeats
MYYYKARIYSPTLGRFLQTDPIGYADQFNLYAYVGDDPVNHSDPSGSLRDVYIGGASDARTEIVRSYVQQQRALHPGRDIQYYEWSDLRGISRAINTAPIGLPLNVIGHSLGGAEAIRQADETHHPITNLITIDPVDLPGESVTPPSLDNVRSWGNITSDVPLTDYDASDAIARMGGRVDEDILRGAGINATTQLHHGDFEGMMRQLHAPQAIDNSYHCTKPDGTTSGPCR